MKYIDADKLIAKIQPLYEYSKDKARYAGQTGISSDCAKWDKAVSIYESVLRIITSLQQEQTEVDLEKEIDRIFFKGDCGSQRLTHKEIAQIAHHFYELALNVRK